MQRHPPNTGESGRSTSHQNLNGPLPPPPSRQALPHNPSMTPSPPAPPTASPPPPPPPPGASSSSQYAWQTGRARQPSYAYQQAQTSQYTSFNPAAYYGYETPPLPFPQSPFNENQPLTSATYIPDGASFGPGVGIPPLDFGHSASPPLQRVVDQPQSFYNPDNEDVPIGRHESSAQPMSPESHAQRSGNFALHPDSETAKYYKQRATTSSNEPRRVSEVTTDLQPSSVQWSLPNVVNWLASNSFSVDWQATFKTLDLHGSQFLELGLGHGGKGNLRLMHSKVYPQLAKQCTQSGSGWNHAREREEGKRLRKLIRSIVDDAPLPVPKYPPPHRVPSQVPSNTAPSSTAEGSLEDFKADGASSTPMTAGDGEESPFASAAVSSNALLQRQQPSQRLSGTNSSNTIDETSGFDEIPRISHSSSIPHPSGHENSEISHSPNPSRETLLAADAAGRSNSSRLSWEGSSQMSPAQGSSKSMGSSLSTHTRYHHKRSVSSESGNGSSMHDSKKSISDTSRSTPIEPNGRPGSSDVPTSAKEHKSLFNIFKRDKKRDEIHLSPEEVHLESPVSPVAIQTWPVPAQPHNIKADVESEEIAIGGHSSRNIVTASANVSHTDPRTVLSNASKKFVMVSPDKWNYRLIDVSAVDSAELMRSILCYNLNISDSKDLTIYRTTPGQIEHHEALNDSQIMAAVREADGTATTLIYIKSPYAPILSAPPMSNTSMDKFNKAMEELSTKKSDRSHRFKNSQESVLAQLDERGDESDDFSLSAPASRQLKSDRSVKEHRREPDRKLKSYLEKKDRGRNSSPGQVSSIGGIKRDRVIDFDAPRTSPFDDKRIDPLVPLRKPPPVPPVSTVTLMKVDSLKRPSSHSRHTLSDRRSKSEAGQGSSVVDRHPALTRIPQNPPELKDHPALRNSTDLSDEHRSSGTVTMRDRKVNSGASENASTAHQPSSYQAQSDDRTSQMKIGPEKIFSDSSETSPSTVKPPTLLSRKSTRRNNGPTFEFKEIPITFEKPIAKVASIPSDDDSDDGLFAIPLKVVTKKGSPPPKGERPLLTLETSRAKKGVSVGWQSPQFHSPQYSAADLSALSTSEHALDKVWAADGNVAESGSRSALSPGDAQDRRQSFASDVWAHRPPAEALVEHLDEFFPNVDLDQPMLDDRPVSPVSSSALPRFVKPVSRESMESIRSDGEVSTFDTAVPKRHDRVTDLAQRESRRSTGLGRTKSIREVVKGAYQHPEKSAPPGIARTNTVKYGEIGRRKSTKMFGARIEQIKPPRGSGKINLATIPQDTLGITPQRQATFKWVKGQLIGKGTFGRVYLGMNTTTGELLAVKQVEVTPKSAGQDKEKLKDMVKALDGEIDTMQHLDHVNIVQYLGCERKEYSISIFLEYIPGGSVGSCLRKHGKFEEPVVSSLTRQTLSGLAYLHHEGILHRDLKADNILLDNDGTCKISDFGISKKTDNIYGNDITNSMQGSVFWMAPEVIRSQDTGYSAKVDIWSLGCVVLEMFAGRRPWSKEEAIGAIYKLGSLNEAPPIPEEVANEISPAALSFMYDCFNVDPADRPTADTLLRAPFCFTDPHFNFLDTDLYSKIRPGPSDGA